MKGKKPALQSKVRYLRTGKKLKGEDMPCPVRLWPCPDYLGEHGKDFYKRIGRLLLYAGVLADTDKESFVNLCRIHQRLNEVEQAIDEHGLVVSDGRGGLKKNPATSVHKSLLDAFRFESENFGLNPRARARLGIKVAPPKEKPGLFTRSGASRLLDQGPEDELLT